MDNINENQVNAKYSYRFSNSQTSSIIVIYRYLEHFATIMEDRLRNIVVKLFVTFMAKNTMHCCTDDIRSLPCM